MKPSFARGVARAVSMSAMFSVLSLSGRRRDGAGDERNIVLTGADRRPATIAERRVGFDCRSLFRRIVQLSP